MANEKQEHNDRTAIRELIDLYAQYADKRQAKKQSELFAENATIEVYQGPETTKPDRILRGRNEIEKSFRKALSQYDITTHFNGQNTLTFQGDYATGEAYCLAHHIFVENKVRTLMVMGIRYEDVYIRQNSQWFFQKRKLFINWIEKRPLDS